MTVKGRPRNFNRDEALRRAMLLFWEKGYDGASLSELTGVMGINSPSLYAAFGSKEGLFRAAVDLYGRTEGTGIWSAVDEAPTAREAIGGFLRASADAFSQPGDPRGCLVVLSALNANSNNAEICRELRKRRAANATDLRARLERAVEAGELPATTDCDAIATFYLTVQQGMSIQARDGASRKRLRTIADRAMAAWSVMTDANPG
jgi:AcrR family transcriptional regulator